MPRIEDRILSIFSSVISRRSDGKQVVTTRSIINAATNLGIDDISPAQVNSIIRHNKVGWAILEEDRNGLHTYYLFNPNSR